MTHDTTQDHGGGQLHTSRRHGIRLYRRTCKKFNILWASKLNSSPIFYLQSFLILSSIVFGRVTKFSTKRNSIKSGVCNPVSFLINWKLENRLDHLNGHCLNAELRSKGALYRTATAAVCVPGRRARPDRFLALAFFVLPITHGYGAVRVWFDYE